MRTLGSIMVKPALLTTAIGAVALIGVGGYMLYPQTRSDARYACADRQMTIDELAAHRGIDLQMVELLRVRRSILAEDLCDIPQAKLDRAIFRSENPKPDHPGEAAAFRLLQQRDETGEVPADGLLRAAEQLSGLQAAQASAPEIAGIARTDWKWIGPGNIGGRVRALVIHPVSPNTMFAGSVSGGLWKTTNGGAKWKVVEDFLSNMAISSLVFHPSSPSILYAGTGEGFFNSDAVRGAGILKSTDGGTTWAQLASTNTSDYLYVNRIAISPNGATLLAATRTGIFRSTNGGSSWTKELTGEVLDVDFHPGDSNKAVAGGRNGKAWYTTNGGDSWAPATGLPIIAGFGGRVETTYARSAPATVFASVDRNGGEVWKSTNGGASYSLVNTGANYLGQQGWYDNIIWVDPTDASVVIVGGIDLWRSTNGGTSFIKISEWFEAPKSAHADHHIIVEHPGYDGAANKTVFFGNDGGVYKAADVKSVVGTTGWTELNNNFGITQFYGAAGHPKTGHINGGTQDNGTLYYTPSAGREGWKMIYGGDGGFAAADPKDADYSYGEYVYLSLHRNSSRGVRPSVEIWNGITDAANGTANFIAPFTLDPNNSNRLLGGGLSLWRSNNVKDPAPTWTAIKSPIGSVPNDHSISAIAVEPKDSGVVYVGHNDGSVYKTTNGTNASPSWSKIDGTLPNRYVTRIVVDPVKTNRVYVAFGGYTPDNVYYSDNGGATWTNRSGTSGNDLPAAPVRGFAVNPHNPKWVYAGTEVGVFASKDRGVTWKAPHDGPSNTSVDELFWMNAALVAVTHGRGLFMAETLGCKKLKVKAKPGAGGKASATPGKNCADGGSKLFSRYSKVALKAKPKSGYKFVKWKGDKKSKKAKTSVTMDGHKTVTAVFKKR